MSALDRMLALRAAIRAVADPVRVRCSWQTFTSVYQATVDARLETEAKTYASVPAAFQRDDGAPIPFEAHQDVEDGVLIVDTVSGTEVIMAWPIRNTKYQTEGLPKYTPPDPAFSMAPDPIFTSASLTPAGEQFLRDHVAMVEQAETLEHFTNMVRQAELDEAQDYDPDRIVDYDEDD